MTDHDPAGAAAPGAPAEFAAGAKLVIGVLLVSAFVVILNETIMAVALPRLMAALEVSASAVQWLTTAFLLTMAVVIPVTGFLIQRINTRPLYFLSMSLFAAGTLLAALAPGIEILVAARIVQAVGTAIMMPLLMTTVMTLVPAHRRGPVMGNISLVISVAPAIGPPISGIILNYLTWPWLFWLILPVALSALVFGGRRMRNVTTPRYVPLDVISVPISALAFGGLVYGLSSFGEPGRGAGNVPGFAAIGVGAAAMAVFVMRQIALQKGAGPLLDLRTFAAKTYTISVSVMAISMMALFGTVILLPIYMQNVLGFDTLQTGLLLMPGALVMGLLGPTVGRLYERFGPAPLIVPGSIVVSAVLWAMTFLGPSTPFQNILIGHLAISVGLAFMFTPLFTASLSAIRPELYSHGSALLGSIQQVAGAAGVALFVAIMSARSAALAEAGISEVLALSSGITSAFMVGASISLLAILAALFIRRQPDRAMPDAPGPHPA